MDGNCAEELHMTEGWLVYFSQIESISALPAQDFKECVLAAMEYAKSGNKYTGDNPIVNMYITLVAPQIEANKRKAENGKKGGRPKKNGVITIETPEWYRNKKEPTDKVDKDLIEEIERMKGDMKC